MAAGASAEAVPVPEDVVRAVDCAAAAADCTAGPSHHWCTVGSGGVLFRVVVDLSSSVADLRSFGRDGGRYDFRGDTS